MWDNKFVDWGVEFIIFSQQLVLVFCFTHRMPNIKECEKWCCSGMSVLYFVTK